MHRHNACAFEAKQPNKEHSDCTIRIKQLSGGAVSCPCTADGRTPAASPRCGGQQWQAAYFGAGLQGWTAVQPSTACCGCEYKALMPRLLVQPQRWLD